jgi:hypothetical protein
VRISAIGLLSAYGVGPQVLVHGMRSGHCPVQPATGIGYPLSPPPMVSRFAADSHPLGPNPPPGETASAALLLQAVAQMVRHWGADRALLASSLAVAAFYMRPTPSCSGATATRLRLPLPALNRSWFAVHPGVQH